MGIASLVLGILSILLALFAAGYQWAGILFGIVGIVLGVLGRKDSAQRGIATAGLACSITGIVLSIILFIACVACVACVAGTVSALPGY